MTTGYFLLPGLQGKRDKESHLQHAALACTAPQPHPHPMALEEILINLCGVAGRALRDGYEERRKKGTLLWELARKAPVCGVGLWAENYGRGPPAITPGQWGL